jgi:DNA-binding transcriptional LysR family regulator
MRYNLTSLKLFLAVVETRSIAKAAERESIATSALSRRISDLEELVGTALLERHSGGVRVTPAGETMARYAQSVFLTFERMRVELSEHGQGERGEIRLFSNSSGIIDMLSQHLQSFLTMRPAVSIHLEEWSSPYIVRAVREGNADLGIINASIQHEGLVTYPYHQYRLVLATPLAHPLAQRSSVGFAETLDFDHVGFHNDSAIHSMISRAAQAAGRPLRLRMQVTSFDAIREMMRVNFGIAVLPEFAAKPYAESKGFAWTPLTDPWATIQLQVCVRDIDSIPTAARRLVTHLTQVHANNNEF